MVCTIVQPVRLIKEVHLVYQFNSLIGKHEEFLQKPATLIFDHQLVRIELFITRKNFAQTSKCLVNLSR